MNQFQHTREDSSPNMNEKTGYHGQENVNKERNHDRDQNSQYPMHRPPSQHFDGHQYPQQQMPNPRFMGPNQYPHQPPPVMPQSSMPPQGRYENYNMPPLHNQS